jgi:hypothetical protein
LFTFPLHHKLWKQEFLVNCDKCIYWDV